MTILVFPGQDLSPQIDENLENHLRINQETELLTVQIGAGIIQNGSEVIALKAGLLQNQSRGSKFTLQSAQKRYIPLQNDLVIGIITARLSEFFRVDIGAQTSAVLSLLSGFEGATKKNRPTWTVGTVIFTRVAMAHPDLEPELSCFDPSGKIPVDLFGELGGVGIISDSNTKKSSILLRTLCNLSKSLQIPSQANLLKVLGKYFSFEIASGANGRIFLEAENVKEMIAISHLIVNNENKKPLNEIENSVRELAFSMGKLKGNK